MSARTGLALPASIVIAGALVGAGLFLGLRTRAQPAAGAPPDIDPQVQAALQREKPRILERCWHGQPPEAHAELFFDVAFAADGSQVALGVQVPRKGQAAAVGKCVQDLVLQLHIDPPGQPAHARVALELP